MQDELGLNVTAMNWRQYDMAIGRFVCVDKLSEANYSQSPYHFADGNPVVVSDPSGLDGGYGLSWASNMAYMNSSLGSSSNWGQSVGNMPNPYDKGIGSAWGDGLVVANFYGAEAANILSSFGSTWVPGATGGLVNGEATVFSGHWERNSSDGFGITGAQTLGAGLATESLLIAASYGALQFIGTDYLIIEPTDLFVPKHIVYGVVAIIATGIIYSSADHFAKQKSSESIYNSEAEHVANARASTKAKHEGGQSRKGRDKGGEKGDSRRTRYK